MTVVRIDADGRVGKSPDARWLTSLVLILLVVPTTLAAHLLVTGFRPSISAGVAVLAVTAAVIMVAPVHRLSGVSAAVVGAQLSGHLILTSAGSDGTAQGCLPVLGRGATAGLNLTLGHGVTVCPPGQTGPDGSSTAALLAVISAVVVLVAHLVIAVLGGWLRTALQVAVDILLALLGAARIVVLRSRPAPITWWRMPSVPPRSGSRWIAVPRTVAGRRAPPARVVRSALG